MALVTVWLAWAESFRLFEISSPPPGPKSFLSDLPKNEILRRSLHKIVMRSHSFEDNRNKKFEKESVKYKYGSFQNLSKICTASIVTKHSSLSGELSWCVSQDPNLMRSHLKISLKSFKNLEAHRQREMKKIS